MKLIYDEIDRMEDRMHQLNANIAEENAMSRRILHTVKRLAAAEEYIFQFETNGPHDSDTLVARQRWIEKTKTSE